MFGAVYGDIMVHIMNYTAQKIITLNLWQKVLLQMTVY